MNPLPRRRILSGALAVAVFAELSSREAPAQADLFGGDVAVLLAILTQSISQAISLTNLVLQTANQVRMMTTMLRQAASGSFPALISLINTARYTFNSLTWGVRAMSFQMAHIDAEYSALFPSGPPPTGTPVAQHMAQYTAWNEEVLGASQVAERQQTSLSNLDSQAAQTQTVLKQAQAGSGVVEELQLIAQMISITNSELLVLNQTLSTTGRVLTDLAAQSASEKQLSLGKESDARAGYTDKGVPVPVPSTLP
jgi:P-type conjugative transfer protein TrbJ